MYQISRLPNGKQVFSRNHIVQTTTVDHSFGLRMVETLRKSKFPDAFQGRGLNVGLFKDSLSGLLSQQICALGYQGKPSLGVLQGQRQFFSSQSVLTFFHSDRGTVCPVKQVHCPTPLHLSVASEI